MDFCRNAIAIWALTLAWGTAGCGAAASAPAGDPVAPPLPDVATGRTLFGALCSGCHGAAGDGRTTVAARLAPPPRDLTRGEYRFRSTASGTLPTRADLLRSIALGLPGTAMPGWQAQLDGRELGSLVLYLETLSPRFAEEPRQPGDVLLAADATETADSPALRDRGRQVYQRMGCGECHGPQGRGDGKAAATARNSNGTVSHVFDFTYGVYKGGSRPLDVYRTFVTGLDGSPMPAYDQSIPDVADRWALVHYVRSLGRDKGAVYYLTERPRWREPLLGDDALRAAPLPERSAPSPQAADPPAAGLGDGW